jgi:hypothetical protein
MGNYTNLKDVLRDVGVKGTNILSLRSSRASLRLDHSVLVGQNNDSIEKSSASTFLEAYKYVSCFLLYVELQLCGNYGLKKGTDPRPLNDAPGVEKSIKIKHLSLSLK